MRTPLLPGLDLVAPGLAKPRDGGSDEFYTPKRILDAMPPIDLDPCAAPCRNVPARRHIVGLEGGDGLAEHWHGITFLNPPYSAGSLPVWTTKACREVQLGRAELVIGLIPARPGAAYWSRNIWGHAPWVGWVQGRVVFENELGQPTEQAGTFDSAVVLWSLNESLARQVARQLQVPVGIWWTRHRNL